MDYNPRKQRHRGEPKNIPIIFHCGHTQRYVGGIELRLVKTALTINLSYYASLLVLHMSNYPACLNVIGTANINKIPMITAFQMKKFSDLLRWEFS
jgi:hypothetical protein